MRAGARGIQSIEVSGRILKALAKAREPMMLKDLAQAANLAAAQCHAYITSLRHVGLVHQDPHSGRYRMGPFAMRLGIGWLLSSPLSSIAIRELRTLTDDIGAMSLLAIWGEFGPTIVHINDGSQPTALNLRQGTIFSVTGTATGRVFAAFGEPEDLEARIDLELNQAGASRSIGSILTREDFAIQIKATRKTGYSVAKGAPIPGINAVAAPVFNLDDKLAMVATLVGPASDLSVEHNATAVDMLRSTTASISDILRGKASPRDTGADIDSGRETAARQRPNATERRPGTGHAT